jgi:hypothetical protein
MKKDNFKTKVVFLFDHENEHECPDVYAYFPEKHPKDGFFTAYSHIGQHSQCCLDYAKESRPATIEEYADLKTELESIGYILEITIL